MPDNVRILRSTLRNPFIQNRVDNAWDARSMAADVPSINDSAFQHVMRTIREVRETKRSHALLLAGEPGSGKTHLLNRVRQWIQQDERSWFVYILPITAPDRVYRDLLQATAGDLTRSAPETHGVNQLAVSVARLFMSDIHAPLRDIATWWQRVHEKYSDGDSLTEFLLKGLDTFVVALGLDSSVVRVIAQFLAGRNRASARDWLLGRSLPEETLTTLGVRFNADEESTARDTLSTLIRLGSEFFTVVLAFDQIEGLQIDPDDRTALLAFGHALAQLLGTHGNLAVITCAQVYFVAQLDAILGRALFDRVGERQSRLSLLTVEQAKELVKRRLRTDTDVEQVRLYEKVRDADPLWPLKTSEIEILATPHVSARTLLTRCRELFDAWQERTEEPSPAPKASLQDTWDAALEEERQRPTSVVDEGVIIDGLIRATATERVKAERATKIKDIDVIIQREGGPVAVAVCNTENMTSLASRLKRLREMQSQNRFRELVVIRDQRLPIKATAKAAQQRLRDLSDAGARVVRLSAEAYAALAALRRLLADAAAGDLTLNGEPVQPEQLRTWLAQHAPAELLEVVKTIAGAPADTPVEQQTVERVQELLEGRWIVPLDAIASDAKLSIEDLRDLTSRESAVFGVISGDRDLLFLRSSAVRRA
ncbi:MAG: ATP-binding protein [Acidobacteriota bacterium]|nr:ATP-binding protein [Acidobacteriota bacterium]